MHAVALLAKEDRRIRLEELGERMKVSKAHLAKVVQQLVHSGILVSTRGPQGGVQIDPASTDASLLDVVEAIEGPLPSTSCLFGKEQCILGRCIFADSLRKAMDSLRKELSTVKVTDLMKKNGQSVTQ